MIYSIRGEGAKKLHSWTKLPKSHFAFLEIFCNLYSGFCKRGSKKNLHRYQILPEFVENSLSVIGAVNFSLDLGISLKTWKRTFVGRRREDLTKEGTFLRFISSIHKHTLNSFLNRQFILLTCLGTRSRKGLFQLDTSVFYQIARYNIYRHRPPLYGFSE